MSAPPLFQMLIDMSGCALVLALVLLAVVLLAAVLLAAPRTAAPPGAAEPFFTGAAFEAPTRSEVPYTGTVPPCVGALAARAPWGGARARGAAPPTPRRPQPWVCAA